MLRNRIAVAAVGGVALLGIGGTTIAQANGDDRAEVVQAPLKDASGASIGEANVVTSGTETRVEVRAENLSPGWHGIHLHTVGKCEGDFTSAGGHLNPGGVDHAGHAGDLPQLLVGNDGKGVLGVRTDRVTASSLMDGDGTAFVVHSGPDNFANIPERYNGGPDAETKKAGDSGTRQACGAFTRR